MSTWNKVLVGLIILVSLGFFYCAARCLRARSYWGEAIRLHQEALDAVAQQKQLLVEGNPAEGRPGVRQLEQEVHRLVLERGRVWRGSVPKLVRPETGQATVVTQLPAPHKDVVNANLFVFEEAAGPTPGAFLGQFVVAAVAGPQWELRPVRPMTDAERERLRRSRVAWSLYEVMPGQPLEATSSTDQAKPDQPAEPGAKESAPQEPAAAVAFGSREWADRLVDYQGLLNELYRQRVVLQDLIGTTTADAQAVDQANQLAMQQVEHLKNEQASLQKEIEAMQAEQKLVAEHRARLEAQLALLKDAAQKTEQANRAAAAQLARLQLEAIRRIDERTRKIAQTAQGR